MSLEFITPQLASAVDHPPPRVGWIHEVKHDGYRTLLIIEHDKARASTPNGFDRTERYPHVMNVAPTANHPRAWIARFDDQGSNPTTLGEAKALAAQMIRALPGDREISDQIFFLNKWGALFADQRAQDEEKPYIEPIAPKGFKVSLGIMGEHKLQVLGCGFRIVTIQFRGKNVVLHHNGKTATIDWQDLMKLVASNRCYRNRDKKAA